MRKLLITVSLLIVAIAFTQCKKDEENNIYPELNGPVGTTGNTFSVSASKKVYFSQGYLQYNPSSNTWRIGANDFDTIGIITDSIPPTYNGWIDRFVYASSGYDSIYPYLKEFPDNKSEIGAMNISRTNYDWGYYNPISNGGNKAGVWRVLTKDEMTYLLSRRNADGYYLAGKGTLYREDGSTLDGTFIMPDNYNSEFDNHFNWGEITETELNKWGGVFLCRYPNTKNNPYMHIGTDGTIEDNRCLNYTYLTTNCLFRRYYIKSLLATVRLVQDCTE